MKAYQNVCGLFNINMLHCLSVMYKTAKLLQLKTFDIILTKQIKVYELW